MNRRGDSKTGVVVGHARDKGVNVKKASFRATFYESPVMRPKIEVKFEVTIAGWR
jgi:hypothetical protein